jgi:hypothetical protein
MDVKELEPAALVGGSKNKAGRIHRHVRDAQGSDDAPSPPFRWPQPDEHHLVVGVVDDVFEGSLESHFFGGAQVTLKDGKLQVVTIVLTGLENLP